MSSQGEEGWPLGLPPVSLRMRLVEAFAATGAGDAGTSFVLNATPSFSSLSSSDLDTESTGSFFPEKTITLGSLIGIAGVATKHPSFRRSLGPVDNTSSGPRRLISRLARRRSDVSGPTTKPTSWSNLIRCGSCRGSYDYPDDNSSVGAPPSLGHFLDEEREVDTMSNNQAKVYINIMFEDDGPRSGTTEGNNPLFVSGGASSPAVTSLLNNSISKSTHFVNNVVFPATIAEEANELQARTSSNHPNQYHESMVQNDKLLRMQAAAKSMKTLQKAATSLKSRSRRYQSMQTLQKAATSLKSRSRRHRRSQSDGGGGGVCVLSCVSHIWGFPKGTSNPRHNQDEDDEDVNSECSSESTCKSNLESTRPTNRGISCYTNYSFDDSDCSIYFDDEEDPYVNERKVQSPSTWDNMEEFEFCTQGINGKWQSSVLNDGQEGVKLGEQFKGCFKIDDTR